MRKVKSPCKINCNYLGDHIFLIEEVLELRVVTLIRNKNKHDLGLLFLREQIWVFVFKFVKVIYLIHFKPLRVLNFDLKSFATILQFSIDIVSLIEVSLFISKSPSILQKINWFLDSQNSEELFIAIFIAFGSLNLGWKQYLSFYVHCLVVNFHAPIFKGLLFE